MSQYERPLLAWHEAGHAVAGLIVGRRFDWVSIDPEPACGFSPFEQECNELIEHCGLVGGVTWDPIVKPFIEKAITTMMGGYAAETIFYQPVTREHLQDQNDYDQVDQLLDTIDLAYCSSFPDDRDLRYATIRAYLDTTVELLSQPQYRTLVERVAGALLERQTLTFDDVLAITGFDFTDWEVPLV